MVTESSTACEPHPSFGEEMANSVSHGIGLVLALVACPLLIDRAVVHGKPWGVFSAAVFTSTMVVMYLASTVYHALPHGPAKRVSRVLEHCAIFLLIAGTYTPVTLVAMRGIWGWVLFGLVWLLAAVGISLNFVSTTRHRWLPGLCYLGMAWLILIAIGPLSRSIQHAGLMWFLYGGIAYTLGMVFFAAKRVPYFHFVWHLFVLLGTTCHFIAVWRYVI